MDDAKIRQIVKDEMHRGDNAGRFTIRSVAHHTHNGTDSKPIFLPTLTYTGFVPFNADITDTNYFIMFPAGWTVQEFDEGTDVAYYEITHNLDTFLYTVDVVQSGSVFFSAIPSVIAYKNTFEVRWYDVIDDIYVEPSFTFQLVQVNNKTGSIPNYTLNNPPSLA